ncbi:hypothetical protein ACFL4A_03130 [bacterium]
MKMNFKVSGLIVVIMSIIVSTLSAGILLEKTKLELAGDISYVNKYVWRGMLQDEDAAIQNTFSISGYGFGVSIWATNPVGNNKDEIEVNELDYDFSYTYNLEELELVIGYVGYDFPYGGYSSEIYFGVNYNSAVSPNIKFYRDFVNDTDYLLVDFSHSFVVKSLVDSIAFGLSYGYNLDDGSDLLLSADANIPFTSSGSSFVPFVNYSVPFGSIKDSGQDKEFIFGLKVDFKI